MAFEVLCLPIRRFEEDQQWRIQGGGGRGDHPPPLVAENFVCSNSNFSPTGAITPDHPPPPPPSENPVSAPDQG